MQKCLFFILLTTSFINAKEVLLQANSSVKQVKFILENEPMVFTEKYQNLNGKITQSFSINEEWVAQQDYFKKFAWAENEEKRLEREEAERKKMQELRLAQEEMQARKMEEEQFVKEAKIEGMKKLVKLELQNVESSFDKLDKYKLENYFMFENGTFTNEDDLNEVKIGLVAQSRGLIIKNAEELEEAELKNTLTKLEVLPEKIERFFRQSVRFAINQCNDTRRLKELLSLIS
ncbi:MAG: hypothetical protein ABIA74_05050 [bacterium]